MLLPLTAAFEACFAGELSIVEFAGGSGNESTSLRSSSRKSSPSGITLIPDICEGLRSGVALRGGNGGGFLCAEIVREENVAGKEGMVASFSPNTLRSGTLSCSIPGDFAWIGVTTADTDDTIAEAAPPSSIGNSDTLTSDADADSATFRSGGVEDIDGTELVFILLLLLLLLRLLLLLPLPLLPLPLPLLLLVVVIEEETEQEEEAEVDGGDS